MSSKTAMRRLLRLSWAGLLILLAACGIAFPSSFTPSLTPPPLPSATPALIPSLSFTSTFLPSPTGTPTTIETSTSNFSPTETPLVFNYIFPIQPASSAGFAEGVASHGTPATDIFAPVGTAYVAVIDAVVDFVSYEDKWDPLHDDQALRGGICIAIIGIDGVRYYGSHLESIADNIVVGQQVQAGQVLGYIGNTGNARETESHLHFGISRPTTPDDWKTRRGQVDPFPFLEAWRDGHNVTPPLPLP